MRKNMPDNLVFIRHGQSEANIIHRSERKGIDAPEFSADENGNIEEIMTIPDRSWRLTAQGEAQARTTGSWLPTVIPQFDRLVVSPFVRTRETAATLNMAEGRKDRVWEENRLVRERSWGEIDSMKRSEFRDKYPANAALLDKDPLYWSPPAGESIAEVIENRVRNFLSTLRRESSQKNVLVVSHGEFIKASRTVIERWSDEEFFANESNPEFEIRNCNTFHYTSINPVTQERTDMLQWVRSAYPAVVDGNWEMVVGEWKHFDKERYLNDELYELAIAQRRRLDLTEFFSD